MYDFLKRLKSTAKSKLHGGLVKREGASDERSRAAPLGKRIAAGTMALVMCVGTVISGVALSNVQNSHASANNGEGYNAMQNELIRYAASLLGSPYVYGKFGGSNPYGTSNYDGYHNNYTYSSLSTARSVGFDCSGYVWYVLTGLGWSTTGFSYQNPVPLDTSHWESGTSSSRSSSLYATYSDAVSSSANTISSYVGSTTQIQVVKNHVNLKSYYGTGLEYWQISSTEDIPVGSIVIFEDENGDAVHSVIYIGEFDDRAAVISYLKSIGVDSDLLTTSLKASGGGNIVTGSGRYAEGYGDSATHFRIECGGGMYDSDDGSAWVGITNIGGAGEGKGTCTTCSVFTFIPYEEDTGSLKITKASEDGVISGVQFQVTGIDEGKNDDYSEIVTTGSDGTVQIDDLVLGKYTVTEVNTKSYYVKPDSQTVEVTADNTPEVPVEVTVTNNLARGDLKVTKTSEDGQVSGLKFRLYGTSTNGTAVDVTATTNSSGVATFTDVLVGTYTLTEVDTPDYYVTPDSQKVTITDDSVTGATYAKAAVANKLKKFKVTVTKVDADTKGAAQGDATLAGAVYGIYQGGTLVDTYTTDANGQFTTTEYYICGDDWTVKEISPSEGYLLDETEYHVDAEAENFVLELNAAPAITSYEEPVYNQIAIVKHTDNGSTGIETPEDGAVFQVYLTSAGSYDNAKSTERDILTTDEDGYAITKDLPYGVYTVHQVSGWDGRDLVSDFTVYVEKDSSTRGPYTYILNNGYYEGYIKIVKVDSETGETIPYAGAGFQIYDPDGNLVTMTYTYPTATTVDTFYTDDNGQLITPETLEYGLGYSIVEVQAPYGYVLDSTPVYFDVTEDDATDELYYDISVVMVNYANAPQKGIITIYKTGEVFSTVEQVGDFYQAVYETQGLSGATYEITAAEDIYTGDGTLRYSKGDVVDTVTTGSDGKATSKELYLGTYNVQEIEAPYGMTLNEETRTVELTYAGQLVEVTTTSTSFVNDRQKVSISLNKVLETDSAYGVGTNGEITSVAFALYAGEDLTATDGTIIPADGLIEIAYCDEDGSLTFDSDLPLGSYYVQEYTTDEHYVLDDTQYAFTFDYAGQDVELVTIALNDGAAIENDLIRGSVSGLKLDEDGSLVEGALFGVFSTDTTEFTEDTAIAVSASDANGEFGFEDVPYGEWVVREISAPDCYVVSDTLHYVTISDAEQVIEITAVNDFVTGSVRTTKTDAEYPDHKLTGATFVIYQDTDGDGDYVSDSDLLVGEMTEIEDGVYTMDDLRYGGYFLYEETAPEGYVRDTNYYYFEITEDGKTLELENDAGHGFINEPITGTLELTKVDVADGTLLPDAGFRICDEDGNTVVEGYTDENGLATFTLRYGKYTYQEFDAPDGYQIDETPFAFEITEDGQIIKAQMTNELIPYDTGDTDTTTPALAIALGSLSAFVGLWRRRRYVM